MKKSKNAFKLNKQKVASLSNELKNSVKGGSIFQQPGFPTQNPTAETRCFYCPPTTFQDPGF